MQDKKRLIDFIKTHQTLFIVIVVGIFLIELEIFAIAAVKSGRKSMIQVSDNTGTLVYQTMGDRLSPADKDAFERVFGPLAAYRIQLITKEVSFPFRAWFAAALGIPMGAVLLFGFIVKAVTSLFFIQGPDKDRSLDPTPNHADPRFIRMIKTVSAFNIFTIGSILFLGVVGFWILPGALATIGQTGMAWARRYKWLFAGAALVLTAMAFWIIYLRYLLAKKSIEANAEVEKHRFSLEYGAERNAAIPIEYKGPQPHKPHDFRSRPPS